MSIKDLINWGELSRMLTGDRMNIRKNRIPQKYEETVNELIELIGIWEAKNELKKQNIMNRKVVVYKAEKIVNGKITKVFEEEYFEDLVMPFSKWKSLNALPELKLEGALVKWYINGEEQLLNC